jgi:eukaryotic-like serine/threonine-protein kinase
MWTGNEATVVMPASAESPSPQEVVGPGTVIGSYQLGAVLGAGGCGTVFEARHLENDRKAAVKVMHDDVAQSNEMIERFVREVQAANLIRHPNIVDIWDLGRLPTGQPYCVMELLEGVNLGALIKRGNFTPAEALEILEPICAAVDAAHRAGIVHRDLKASNIQISGPAGDRRIKLLDFGIAKLTELGGGQALTAMGRKLGTPTSMSPEQIRGALVDSRTDIYALGVLLFYMLTCRHPFEAREPFELERMHLENPPPRASDLVAVGAEVDAVVVRCLAKRPAERYPTVTEFVEGLRAAVARSAPGTASGRELRPATAGAILIEVVVDEQTESLDDATLMDLASALERAEALLVEAGLQVALQTGSAAVGVSLLSSDEDEQRDQRAHLVEQAAQLHRALDEREGKQSGVGVTVCVHVDQALVAHRESGEPDVTGPILSLGGWMPPSGGGLYLTSTTIDGLTIAIDKFTII